MVKKWLSGRGVDTLWKKMKTYVANHHMDVSTSQSPSGLTILQFGDTWSNPNLYATGVTDTYGHTTVKVRFPGFALPTVECGTVDIATTGSGKVTFSNMKNTPKLIKIYFIDQSNEYGHSSKELCSVWYDGETVVSTHGAISSVSQTGFSFIGNPGKHYWEAWG